jgi:hypothetical protein
MNVFSGLLNLENPDDASVPWVTSGFPLAAT